MIKGPIQSISTNDWGYVSIKVNGTFFGADKKGSVSVGEDDFVEFEAFDKPGKNGKAYPTFKFPTLRKIAAPTQVQDNTPSNGGYKPPKNDKEDYWQNKGKEDAAKEPRIVYLAAYERAVKFADLALRNGAFAALEKAKPAAKLEVLQAFVHDQALQIMVDTYSAELPTVGDATEADDAADDEAEQETEAGGETWG